MIIRISDFLFKILIPVAIFLWLSILVTKKASIPHPVDISNLEIPYKSFSNPDSRTKNIGSSRNPIPSLVDA